MKGIKVVYIFLLLLSMIIMGCQLGALRQPQITPKEVLNIQNPLLVEKKEIGNIQKIALPNIHDFCRDKKMHADTLRFQNISISLMRSELQKNRRFDIVSPSAFIKKWRDLDLADDTDSMEDDEFNKESGKVIKELNCDAALILSPKSGQMDMAKGLFTVMFTGMADYPLTYTFRLVNRDGKVLWRQEQDSTITMAQIAFVNVPDDELKKMLQPLVVPAMKNLIEIVGVPEPKVEQQAVTPVEKIPKKTKETPPMTTQPIVPEKNQKLITPAQSETESAPLSMTTKQIQQRLSELGYKPGPSDGKMGTNTINALKKFQQDNNLKITGKADVETIKKLQQKKD